MKNFAGFRSTSRIIMLTRSQFESRAEPLCSALTTHHTSAQVKWGLEIGLMMFDGLSTSVPEKKKKRRQLFARFTRFSSNSMLSYTVHLQGFAESSGGCKTDSSSRS